MEKTYIDSVNEVQREAVMRLYGTIGPKVDGDYFAHELASLDRGDFDLIHIRMNSPGGNVFQGMSIISAIRSMNTPVCVHIDGIAASMAAVIAVAADRVCMMDFAKMMIHDPYFSGTNEKAMSAKQKKALARLTDMLRKVLIRRGKDEAAMAKLMQEETWFSAEEAKAAGLCDEITGSAKNEYMGLEPLQLVAAVEAEYQTNQEKMEKINLSAEANAALGSKNGPLDEAAVSAAIIATIAAKDKEIADLKTARDAADAEVTRLKKEKEDTVAAEAVAFAESLVKAGKIDADAKEDAVAMYKANPESARKIFNGVPERTKLAGMVGKGGGDSAKFAAMSWDELDRAGLLAELKANDPDLYEKKYKEMSAALRVCRG
ncbi:ATP-dependent protease ClpP, protease subunit [Alistipes timonensis JC136]|uniref:ATP-dependent Clp protease proteolytic subunit n=1 Tax=Alistipes timonensis JC136 TaxID=1033731 RepID=A0A1H4DDD0_9BACT|nr:head maturation protease, ClpP-related [Alistipes timonensis]SEA70409.1 ATP-dependent protease ClpP, protease subunit [Alistipes timonensis JC136]